MAVTMIDVNCEHCGKVFQKSKARINQAKKEGSRMFCSTECHKAAKTTSIIVPCGTCGKPINVQPKRLKQSKTGKVFCDNSCAASHNNRVREASGNFIDGRASYRDRALKHYGPKCRICGYDIEAVLHVHHKDEDRGNNDLSNLDVLCPTHHYEYHYGIRSYASE